jgi:hypothetical protein
LIAANFIVEIPLSFCAFITGDTRVFCALATIAYQSMMHFSGNFGFFNILTSILCLPLFDAHARVSLSEFFTFDVYPLVHLIIGPGTILSLLFNSWCTHSWYYWPSVFHQRLVKFYRLLEPFGIIHSYGTFPPHAHPDIRFSGVFEGSLTGLDGEWSEYENRHAICHERSEPVFLSPFHDRFDYALFYLGMGLTRDSLFHPVFAGDPYTFGRSTLLHRIAQRLLEGESIVVKAAFKRNPFASAPGARPRFVRVRWYSFSPTSHDTYVATGGQLWDRQLMGTLVPRMTLDRDSWAEWCPAPDFFHFDSLPVWKLKSPLLQSIIRNANERNDPCAAVKASLITDGTDHSIAAAIIPAPLPPESQPVAAAAVPILKPLPILVIPSGTGEASVSAADRIMNIFWEEFVPVFGHGSTERKKWIPAGMCIALLRGVPFV